MKKIAIASINFCVLSFRCRGLIWGLLTILIIMLTPAINAAQQSTSTLASEEFIASKIEDIVGVWESRLRGKTCYTYHKADGTFTIAYTIENLEHNPLSSGTCWFEGTVLHTKTQSTPKGSYEVKVYKKEGTPIRLSYTVIDDPVPPRVKDLSLGKTWVASSPQTAQKLVAGVVSAQKGWEKTLTLPSGEVILDMRGEWDALIELLELTKGHAPEPLPHILLIITQEGNTFSAVQQTEGKLFPKGTEKFKGVLDKDGFKEVQEYACRLPVVKFKWVPVTWEISENGNKIVFVDEDRVKTTLTRR
jgi:hypothetical protein